MSTTSPLPSKLNYPEPNAGEKSYEVLFDSEGTALKSPKTDNFYYYFQTSAAEGSTPPDESVNVAQWFIENILSIENLPTGSAVPVTLEEDGNNNLTIFRLAPGYIYEISVALDALQFSNDNVDSESVFTYALKGNEDYLQFANFGANKSISVETGTTPAMHFYAPVISNCNAVVKVDTDPLDLTLEYTANLAGAAAPNASWEYFSGTIQIKVVKIL